MEASSSPELFPGLRVKIRFGTDCLAMRVPRDIKFGELTQRIGARLPSWIGQSVRSGPPKLYYRDGDGDMIWVDGDEALEEAFHDQEIMPSSSSGNVYSTKTSVYFELKMAIKRSDVPPVSGTDIVPTVLTTGIVWQDSIQEQAGCDEIFIQHAIDPSFGNVLSDTMDVDEDLPPFHQSISLPLETSNTHADDHSDFDVRWDQWLSQLLPSAGDHLSRRNRNGSKHPRFTMEQKSALQAWYDAHSDYPYPEKSELEILSEETKIETRRIKNWFWRARNKDPLQPYRTQLDLTANDQLEHEHNEPVDSHPMGSDLPSLNSAMGMSSLDVWVASPVARSLMSECSERAQSITWGDQNNSVPDTAVCNADNRWLAGREHDKLEWWLEQLVPVNLEPLHDTCTEPQPDLVAETRKYRPKLRIRCSSKPSSAPTNDGLPMPSPCAEKLGHPSEDWGVVRGNLSQFYRTGRAMPSPSPSPPNRRNWSLGNSMEPETTDEWTRMEKDVPARSEASFGGNSGQSGASTSSNITVHSSCSYTSFGPRRGRRRPRRIAVEETNSYVRNKDRHTDQSLRSRSSSMVSNGISEKPFSRNMQQSRSVISAVPSANRLPRKTAIERAKFTCPICHTDFTRRTTLKRHQNAIHAPKTFWVCGPPNDPRNMDLLSSCHFCTSHIPPRWYECSHKSGPCVTALLDDRKFYRKDNFKEHLKAVHKVTSEELSKFDIERFEYKESSQLSSPAPVTVHGTIVSKGSNKGQVTKPGEASYSLGLPSIKEVANTNKIFPSN